MKPTQPCNVLFLCTENSARSIIAEAILNREGGEAFRAWSAGTRPAGKIKPEVLEMLTSAGYQVGALHSKSLDVFTRDDAPQMDFVITVCDRAAGEPCPAWPGHPVLGSWSIPEPLEGREGAVDRHLAVAETHRILLNRIKLLISLPIEQLDRLALEVQVHDIGR